MKVERDSNTQSSNNFMNCNGRIIENPAKIIVVGVGGAGGNAINRMMDCNFQSATFVAINTDAIDLAMSKAHYNIQIGAKITNGQGAGAVPEVGQRAAEENKLAISEAIKDANMVFITAGMGGGTGTGAAPVVASIAKELGKLTVAVVTKPFGFEGVGRRNNAEIGIANLMKVVDTIVVVPNDRLLQAAPKLSMEEAFKYADDVLRQGIQGISDLITTPAMINLDFNDVRSVMENKGVAHMGIGIGRGENRVVEAIRDAVKSPLLETEITGARFCILNIMVPTGTPLTEINEAAEHLRAAVDPNANIFFGADVRSNLDNDVVVTVIATGFAEKNLPGYANNNAQNGQPIYSQQGNQQQNQQSNLNNNPYVKRDIFGGGGQLNVFGNPAPNQGFQGQNQGQNSGFQGYQNPYATQNQGQYAPQQAPVQQEQPRQGSSIPNPRVAPAAKSNTPKFIEALYRKNDENNQ